MPPRPASRGSSPSARTSTTAAGLSRSPSGTTGSSRSSASTRTKRARRPRTTSPRCASCSRIRRRSRSARPGSTGSATTRRPTTSGGSSPPQLELAAELGKPVVIHTRAADDDTLAALAEPRGNGRPPLLLVAAPAPDRARARAGTSRSPATPPSRRRSTSASRRPRSRRSASSPRPTRRTSRRSPSAAGRTSRRTSSTRSPRSRRLAGRIRPSSSADRRERSGSASACEEGVRPALPRRPEHPRGDRAARRARAGRRRARDRPRGGRPHALPRRARPPRPRGRDRPRRSSRRSPGSRDERRPRLRRRAPARAPAGRDEARREPPVQRRDAADRREPRRPAERPALVRDGAAGGRRPVLRSAGNEGRTAPSRCSSSSPPSEPASTRSRAPVFRPPPNVDSALVAFRRTELPADFGRVKQVVTAAFAHRRKTLPNSLALAGLATREEAAAALAAIGRPPDDPCRGARAGGVRRAREGPAVSRAPAPAKINLALVVGPMRDDGKHEVLTVLQRIDLVDRIELDEAPELRVDGFAGDTLVGAALRELARSRGDRAALARARSRSRSRSQPVSAVAAPTRRPRSGSRTRRSPSRCRPSDLHGIAARDRRRRPVLPHRRPAARLGRRKRARAARPAAGLLGRRPPPARHGEDLDRRRVRRLRRARTACDGFAERREALARRARRGQAPARPRRSAAERPRELAARRGASRGGRLPRGRLRCRAGAVRAVPSPPRRRRRETHAPRSRPNLARGTCVVRLTRVDRAVDAPHRRAGPRRLAEGPSPPARALDRRGRGHHRRGLPRPDEVDRRCARGPRQRSSGSSAGTAARAPCGQVLWIFVVSQLLAVVLVLFAVFFKWLVILGLIAFAVIGLAILYFDRR